MKAVRSTACFTVTQSATAVSDTVISYTVAGSATAGTDYAVLGGSVTIPAGSTTATIDVTGIVADSLVEGTETIEITLSSITASDPGITIDAASDNDTINILDGDAATVSIAGTTDGNEAGPADGVFTVTQTAAAVSDTVISYIVAGTATAGTDYAVLGGSVTIPAGSTTATIDVTGIVADSLVEGTETVEITLGSITASDPGVTLDAANDNDAINILDGDAATVSLTGTIDGNESGPVDGVFTVTQTSVAVSDTVVSYTIAGSATAGDDYTPLTGTVTIPAGSTTATIDVTGIVADSLVEGTETIEITLGSITASDPGVTIDGGANNATINLLDGDSAAVSIAGTADANEAGPANGQFTITQTTASASDTVVTYTVSGTAIAAGVDYATLSGSVTVPAGDLTATIDVTGIVADTLVEGTETIIVTMTGTDNPGVAVAAGPNNAATISLLDNSTAEVSVAAITDANEAGPINGQFTVTQSAASASATVVTYTVAGSATAGGVDYATLSGSVTVPAGDLTANIDVTGIVTDALVEGTETVVVTLTGTDDVAVTVAANPNNTASIDLLDNNTAEVSIAGTTDGNEAGPVNGEFTLTQTAISDGDTVVSYTVSGTAASGVDYTALSGSVTIPAGSATAIITVPVIDDGLVEGVAETVVVTLDSITASDPGITIDGANNVATVNISDDDSATLSIAATTQAADETGPVNGVFTVTQSAASVNDTVISYTVAGTATAGDDYTALSGTVTILGGSTFATIAVPVIDDALVEGVVETVEVTLSSITASDPGVTIDAGANTDFVNIADNDTASVSIVATANGNEAGPVDGLFTLTQSAISSSDTVLSYTVAGTATAGADYTGLSGTVTIPGGATTASIVVPVLDDVLAEDAEMVQVVLSAITASDPGISIAASPDDSATITITDDDADLITTKTVNNAAPLEGATVIYTITVTNNGPVQVTNVSLADTLPAGVTWVSDDSGGAYDSASGLWTIGTIEAGAANNVATLNIIDHR